MTPFVGEQQLAQAVISNQADFTTSFQPATFPTVLARTRRSSPTSGCDKPYGYVDWWPISPTSTTPSPYDKPDVRWALSYYMNRQQIVDVGLAAGRSPGPDALVPGLRPYVDSIKDLLDKYPTLEYDVKKGDALREERLQEGQRRHLGGRERHQAEVRDPRLEHVCGRRPGRPGAAEASRATPPTSSRFDNRFFKGEYVASCTATAASRTRTSTLRLPERHAGRSGAHLANFPKWTNKEFDAVVDEMDDR